MFLDQLQGVPASAREIAEASGRLEFQIPEEYLAFLGRCNGWRGYWCANSYLELWGASELPILNKEYNVSTFAPGLLLVGSNGCGEAIAYDSEHVGVHHVPFVGMSRNHLVLEATSLSDLLRKLGPPELQNVLPEQPEVVEIKPILFGGDPLDIANKTRLSRTQHIAYANYWNRLYQDVKPMPL